MDKEIILALIEYTSWPIVVILLIVSFKDQIKKIKHFKVKDYEFSFEEEIKSITKDMKSITPNGKDWQLTSDEFLLNNMKELSMKSPLAVVIQANGVMENSIIRTAKKITGNEIINSFDAIMFLFESGYIYEATMNTFFRLQALKERYCNFENELVTMERALETADVMLGTSNSIKFQAEIAKEAGMNIDEINDSLLT